MIEDGSSNLLITDRRKEIDKEKYILHFDGIEDYMNVRFIIKIILLV